MAERTAEFRVRIGNSGQYYPCTLKLEETVYAEVIEHDTFVVYGLIDPRDNSLFTLGRRANSSHGCARTALSVHTHAAPNL